MSAAYALRELARAGLEAIWRYTIERWGIGQAKRYQKGLFAWYRNSQPCVVVRSSRKPMNGSLNPFVRERVWQRCGK